MSADFVRSIPVTDIRKCVADFARPCLAELLQSEDTADLCGFAICTISDAVSVYWTANTRCRLAQKVTKELAEVKGPDGPTAAELRDWYEFDPANWPFSDGRSPVSVNCKAIGWALWNFWQEFKSGVSDDDDDGFIDCCFIGSTRIFHALGDGLSDAVSEVDWSPAGGRQNATVLVWVNSPGKHDRQAVREIAAKLNPENLYANFARTYYPSDEP